MENVNLKMQNDNVKFKDEFKKRIYQWVLRLVKFIEKLPKETVCGVMGRQLLRSGTSVIANYIEANSASSRKDFTNFFTHSLKSANESKVWLCLLRDIKKGDVNELSFLLDELTEISKIVASSIITLKGKR
jgi:four helix bundle protein